MEHGWVCWWSKPGALKGVGKCQGVVRRVMRGAAVAVVVAVAMVAVRHLGGVVAALVSLVAQLGVHQEPCST
jgi:hypothetical protein